MVLEVFLGPMFTLLFEMLRSNELRAAAGLWKVEEKMKKLECILSKIQAVLNDAEERQIRDMAVRKWLEELKYVAYDVEDLLDQFSTEALRLEFGMESRTISMQVRQKLIHTFSSLVSFLFGRGSKIDKINCNLERIAIERDVLGLREGVEGRTFGVTRRPPTSSLLNESHVYGRDEDKETIIRLLLSDERSRNVVTVIPIIGMAGLGKTTLAQFVYNDERVTHYFDLKAWAYVSEDFNVLKLAKAILESTTMSSHNLNELDPLQNSLRNILRDRKFLLVLDDVWNENRNDWLDLISPLTEGSKIIITTRSETVSSITGTVAAHQLNVLSDENCMSLFQQHAFVEGTSNANPELTIVGMEIVKKCKGLPLAGKTLGGLLRSKTNRNEWEKILRSKIWELAEDRAGILPSLRLSYHHLQPHLKQCFAYCSIFPKGYKFEKEKLVLLWIGEGFMQPKEGEQMEDIGGKCFDELFERSFFKRSSHNRSMFVMHDLMNDLAQSVSRGICFRLEDKLEGGQVEGVLEKARHSSYLRGRYDKLTKFDAFYEAKYLRTFLPLSQQFTKDEYSYLPKQVLGGLFSKLNCLRVLCLSWYYITELPDSISNLKNLRYLDLSHTPIERLPDSIGALYCLQTLILIGCHKLSELPNDMGNLINLWHLEIDSLEKMPLGIGSLTSLQKLPIFVVGKRDITSGANINELRSLSHLGGSLCISHLENVTDVMEGTLKDKQRLQKLKLEWRIENVQDEATKTLDGLQPPLNLKELTLDSFSGYKFSNWIGDATSLSNLVDLKLINCKYCESLPPVGKLPSLKYLSINGMDRVKKVGREFYGYGVVKPFPSLEIFKLENMSLLKEWLGVEKVVPCLRELRILNCPLLEEILPCFPTLLKLEIEDCEKLVTFPSMVNPRDPIPGAEEASSSMASTLEEGSSSMASTLEEGSSSMASTLGHPSPCCREIIIKKCCRLQRLPPRLPYLEKLGIHECCNLYELPMHPSLYTLHISGFPRLRSLTGGFLRTLTALEELKISKCEDFGNQVELQHLVSLRQLEILSCCTLVSLPEDGLPTSLQYLRVSCCHDLERLPHMGLLTELQSLYLNCCRKIEYLPMGLDNLISLQHLEIRWCPRITSFPEMVLPIMLQTLNIIECNKLESLPDGLNNHMALKYLKIAGCSCLVTFPRGGLPTTIQKLEIMDCPKLESLPDGLHNLSFLEHFEINNCPSLLSFPEGGLPFYTKSVRISQCENLKSLSDWWGFQELVVYDCPSLIISFLELEIIYPCLQSLSVKDCKKLVLPESGLKNLTSLIQLTIGEIQCLEPSLECLHLPTNLSYLCFEKCQHLESLPEGLQNLDSLDELKIIDCPMLASLLNVGLPTMLSCLVIRNCPLLKEHCQMKKAKYWSKIDHIPCIMIDDMQLK